jgi:hypothetical protein
MRIISTFRDYYDTALAHGADMSLVYQRETTTTSGARDAIGIDLENLPRLDEIFDPSTGRNSYADTYALHVLLFCGQYLPFVERCQENWKLPQREVITRHWDLASVEAAIAGASGPVQDAYARKRSYLLSNSHMFTRQALTDAFAHRPSGEAVAAVHASRGAPVILYRNVYRNIHTPDAETVLNPNLRDLGFQSQRDPFTAFQEIAMYVGGVMRTPERDTVQISDADRAAKHGMDRWSFRKKVR